MQSHRAAEIFPKMAGADFEALVDDIRQHGQREPIVVHDGLILDGRNRYQACLQLGIEPLTAEWDGTGTPEAFVISMNIHRRHLGSGQRAMIANRLANMPAHRPGKSANLRTSQECAAKTLNVSPRSVQHAAVVQEKAAPELVASRRTRRHPGVDRRAARHLVEGSSARHRHGAREGKIAAKSAKRIRTGRPAAHMRHGSQILQRRRPSTIETCASCATPGPRRASRRGLPF